MIVGVSDETESLLEDYIAKKGVEFGIIRAQGALQQYGGRGYPTFVTIGPDGAVVHGDGVPSESVIEENLRGVSLIPEMPSGSTFSALKKAWEKHDYARVHSELNKGLERAEEGSEDHAAFTELRARFDRVVEGAGRSVERYAQGPDYFRSEQKLEEIVESFEGLAPAEAAEKVLERFADDDKIKDEIRAGKEFHALVQRFDATKSSQKKKLLEALAKLRKSRAGTYAAEQAANLAARLAD